jgi:hypothetical protein
MPVILITIRLDLGLRGFMLRKSSSSSSWHQLGISSDSTRSGKVPQEDSKATINPKLGRILSKVKRHELVDNYQTQIHNNAFGYKTVEFEKTHSASFLRAHLVGWGEKER